MNPRAPINAEHCLKMSMEIAVLSGIKLSEPSEKLRKLQIMSPTAV